MNPLKRDRRSLVLAVLAAVGLGIDAYVHLHLAPNYDPIGDTITQGALFRIEAVGAILVGLALLFVENRLVWLSALAVGIGGVVAVLLYRYVNVPAIGPVPSMYEPVWFGEKTLSAVAEGAVVVICLVREGLRRSSRRVRIAA